MALAYRALLTAGSFWRGWRNGYQWVLGALLVGIFGMRGSAAGASCWWFLFLTLGGVVLSGGIICTIFPDWFGGCGVPLSRSGVAGIGGMYTLGKFGATLGGRPGDTWPTTKCGPKVAKGEHTSYHSDTRPRERYSTPAKPVSKKSAYNSTR